MSALVILTESLYRQLDVYLQKRNFLSALQRDVYVIWLYLDVLRDNGENLISKKRQQIRLAPDSTLMSSEVFEAGLERLTPTALLRMVQAGSCRSPSE